MLTLDRQQQPPALREWRPFEPPFLAGVLFAALALVPLTASAPLTPPRLLGLGVLLGAALGLMLVSRPRSRLRPLPGRKPSAVGTRERTAALELDASPMPPTYRAVLVLGDGSRHTVLERPEPGGVLEDAALLARELGVPLTPAWGIDESTLDSLVRPLDPANWRWGDAATYRFESPPFAGQRNAAWTTLWASAFVFVATIAMSDAARSRVTPGALSLTLPGVSVLVALGVALWLFGLRGELELGPTGVTRKKFWFKVALPHTERLEIPVAAAAFVTPAGGAVGHLVVSDGAKLFAFPLRGDTAELARLREALPARRTHRAAE